VLESHPKKMGYEELFSFVADPLVTSVNIEIAVESTQKLHAELLNLYLYCLARVGGTSTGVLDLARVTPACVALVATYFLKLGVVCHLDAPAPETELSRLAACVALPSGVHSLRFSLAAPERVACHASASRWRGV
jgi:hypothetical protein